MEIPRAELPCVQDIQWSDLPLYGQSRAKLPHNTTIQAAARRLQDEEFQEAENKENSRRVPLFISVADEMRLKKMLPKRTKPVTGRSKVSRKLDLDYPTQKWIENGGNSDFAIASLSKLRRLELDSSDVNGLKDRLMPLWLGEEDQEGADQSIHQNQSDDGETFDWAVHGGDHRPDGIVRLGDVTHFSVHGGDHRPDGIVRLGDVTHFSVHGGDHRPDGIVRLGDATHFSGQGNAGNELGSMQVASSTTRCRRRETVRMKSLEAEMTRIRQCIAAHFRWRFSSLSLQQNSGSDNGPLIDLMNRFSLTLQEDNLGPAPSTK